MVLRIKYYAFLLGCIFISGCDIGGFDYYEIDNTLNCPVNVLMYAYIPSSGSYHFDTTYDYIPAKTKKIVYCDDGGIYGRCEEPDPADTLYGIKSIKVFINDTLVSKKEFAQRQYWNYKSGAYTGIYTTTIDTADFIK